MTTHHPAKYRGVGSKRQFPSGERFSTNANRVSSSQDGDDPFTIPGPKGAMNHSNTRDSAIDMSESMDTPVQSAHLAPDQVMESLQDELFSSLISTHQEKRGFFAKDQLSKILTEDCVRNELTRHFEDSLSEETIAEYAKTICQGTVSQGQVSGRNRTTDRKTFIKIFAILIIIEKTKSIIKLLEEDVNDSDLPLIKVPRPNDERKFDLRVSRDPHKVLRSFQKRWNQLNIRNFDEWQWTTLPVEFAQPTEHREVQHYQLEEQRILPFVKDSREQKPHFSRRTELEGGFASVFQVAIHPQHHDFQTLPDKTGQSYFAVKRLHSQNKKAFQREVEMLNKFSGNKHDHLISLLATYEQFDRFFLVFDWAEADLQAYWRKVNSMPTFDWKTVLWMAKQCRGIASGIIKIHEHVSIYAKDSNRPVNKNVVFGHHGDIKPENVLWFAETDQEDCNVGGTLKLSDFGLAEVSVHRTISMAPKSKWGVSLGYRAPEADLHRGAAIGRSYDIWTLGCLYLEFITWMLGGSQLLDEFLEARKARDATWHDIETHTFFELKADRGTGEPIAVIKPAVTQVSLIFSMRSIMEFTDDYLVHPQSTFTLEMLAIHSRLSRHGGGQFAGGENEQSTANRPL